MNEKDLEFQGEPHIVTAIGPDIFSVLMLHSGKSSSSASFYLLIKYRHIY